MATVLSFVAWAVVVVRTGVAPCRVECVRGPCINPCPRRPCPLHPILFATNQRTVAAGRDGALAHAGSFRPGADLSTVRGGARDLDGHAGRVGAVDVVAPEIPCALINSHFGVVRCDVSGEIGVA
jgi:hypothetical protein